MFQEHAQKIFLNIVGQGELTHLVDLPVIFYKGDNLCDSMCQSF